MESQRLRIQISQWEVDVQFYLNGRETRLDDFVSDDLARAVVNSLFSWRRAAESDETPGMSKEGWWADTFSNGDEFGSRLWLLQRAKLTDEALLKAKEYVREALQWLIDDAVVGRIDVDVVRNGVDRMDMSVVLIKPDQSSLDMRFQNVWEK